MYVCVRVCLCFSIFISPFSPLHSPTLKKHTHNPKTKTGTYRSEPTAAAADLFLSPHWARLRVEVLNVLPLLRPRAWQSVDDHHWLRDFMREGDYFGAVGVEIARMLTGLLCPFAGDGEGEEESSGR